MVEKGATPEANYGEHQGNESGNPPHFLNVFDERATLGRRKGLNGSFRLLRVIRHDVLFCFVFLIARKRRAADNNRKLNDAPERRGLCQLRRRNGRGRLCRDAEFEPQRLGFLFGRRFRGLVYFKKPAYHRLESCLFANKHTTVASVLPNLLISSRNITRVLS